MNKFYECIKGNENLIDREMEAKYWTHPANSVKITEVQEGSKHTVQVNIDGSKGEHGVGTVITIFTGSNMTRQNIDLTGDVQIIKPNNWQY